MKAVDVLSLNEWPLQGAIVKGFCHTHMDILSITTKICPLLSRLLQKALAHTHTHTHTHCALMVLGTEGSGGRLDWLCPPSWKVCERSLALAHWCLTFPGRAGWHLSAQGWSQQSESSASDGTLMPAHMKACAQRQHNRIKSVYSLCRLYWKR